VKNPIRTPLLLVSLFLLAGAAISVPRDGSTGPVGIVPSPNEISAGSAVTIQITLGAVSNTPTVVSLSSSSSYLAVPSTVTCAAGSQVVYVTGVASPYATTTGAAITATANGYQAQCGVTVNAE
jgi:hypothetical protein